MNDSKMREPVGGPSWPAEREAYGPYTEDCDETCSISGDGCAVHSDRRGVEWTTR